MVFRAGAVPRIDAEGHLPDDVVEVLAEDLEGLVEGATDPADLAALVTGPTNDLKTALNATYAPVGTYGRTGTRRLLAVRAGVTANGGGDGVTTAVAAFGASLIPLARPLAATGLDLSTASAIRIPTSVPPSWYEVDAVVRVEGGSAGERAIGVKVNGSSAAGVGRSNYGGGTFSPAVAGKVFLNPGDTLTLEVYSQHATNVVARGGNLTDVQMSVSSVDPLPVKPCIVGTGGETDRAGLVKLVTGTWMERDDWNDLTTGPQSAAYLSWIAAHPDTWADIGVPLIPHNSGAGGEHTSGGRANWNTLLDEVIAGTHDAKYTAMGAALATKSPNRGTFARLWWEMNQYPASIDAAKFKAAWTRAVPLIRAGYAGAARSGQVLRVVYCYMASGTNHMDFYPADESTVDVIGADVYAAVWGSGVPTLAALLRSTRVYLDQLAVFAALHAKPTALGEWGNWGTAGTGTGNYGRGDVPEVIDLFMDWVEQNAAEYTVYFDINGGGTGIDLSNTPVSLARLIERHRLLAPRA